MPSPFLVQKKATFTGHKDCIYALCGTSNQNEFISSGSDGHVVLWNTDNPDHGQLLAKVAQSVYALNYESESNNLLIGQNFEGVHRISLETKTLTQSLKITDAAIFDILVVNHQIFIATGNGAVEVLAQEALLKTHSLKFSEKSARCLVHIPEMDCIAIGYSDGFIRMLSLKNFSVIHEIPAHTNSVFALHFTAQTGILYSGSRDAHLKAWQILQFPEHSFLDIPAHLYAINAIVSSPNNQLIATASMDKSIKLWDAGTLKLLKVINKARDAGHATSINKLLWTNNPCHLVSASDDRTLSLWEIKENL